MRRKDVLHNIVVDTTRSKHTPLLPRVASPIFTLMLGCNEFKATFHEHAKREPTTKTHNVVD
eukprot:8858548-Lingulodinium_polyedra.AAC.1